MSIKARILKVGFAKSAEMGIITLVRFFSVPLFLTAWSPELYGEWLILYSLLTYFSLGGLGFGQAAANEMTMSEGAGQREKSLVVYRTTFVITAALAGLLLLLAALFVLLVPFERWMELKLISAAQVDVIVLAFCTYVILGLFVTPPGAAYRSAGLYHRGIFLSNASLLAEFGVTAAFLFWGFGPVALALGMLGVRVLFLVVVLVDQTIVVPWARPGFAGADRQIFKSLITPALSFAAFPIGSTVINQGIIMAIGAVLGPVAVVVFNSLRTLSNLLNRVFDLINQAFYPEMSLAWGAGNKELLRRLHRISCQASLWLGLATAAGLVAFGPWIFRLWVRGKVEMDLTLFLGFVALLVLRAGWYTSFVLPSSINRHQRLTLIYMITSIVGLGLSAVALRLGLFWSLAGFFLVELVMITSVLPQSLRLSEERARDFVPRLFVPPSPRAALRLIRAGKAGTVLK